MFINIARWWLTVVLVLIPFHHRVYTIVSSTFPLLSTTFNLLDEITLIVLLPYALLIHLRDRRYRNPVYILVISSLSAITISCLISGIVNHNPIFITLYGTFAYVKFFLFIFVYSAFFREHGDLRSLFRPVLVVAVVIGIVAILQEIWALVLRYLLGRDVFDSMVYLLAHGPVTSGQVREVWEFGIYNPPSLLSHRNLLGLYSLFILVVYLHMYKRQRAFMVVPLLSGVLLSASRVSYAGLILVMAVEAYRGRRWLVAPIIVILILLGSMVISRSGDIDRAESNPQWYQKTHFRDYARVKALEVWRDHPVWGAGPGMFGGAVAYKTVSPLYEEYNFMLVMDMIHSLDQLWPQVLAEIGIIGTLFFIALFICLLISFRGDKESSSLMIILTLLLLIYTLGSNLNNVSIMLIYSALAGITIGSSNSYSMREADRRLYSLTLFYPLVLVMGIIASSLYPVNKCVQGDCLDGHGVYKYSSGAVYRGEWKEGRRHGYGELLLRDGTLYRGEWKEGRMDGYGIRRYQEGYEYAGQWRGGHREGYGRLEYDNGVVIEGQWGKGRLNGYGVMLYADRLRYAGQWREGRIEGYGRLELRDAYTYEGQWKRNRMHGWGVMTLSDGRRRIGRWRQGRFINGR